MKTSELTDAALDWAVAKCLGYQGSAARHPLLENFFPHRLWEQGGPIIEREGIKVGVIDDSAPVIWAAQLSDPFGKFKSVHSRTGPTPLIAAMRCYVASKLGDDVEIPEELK